MLQSSRSWVRAAALAAFAAAPWLVHAQTPAMPSMQGQGAARYACGGIGSDESSAMRAAMKDHPLALLFARADGAYLTDVAITIKDAAGATALSMRASGPVCLVDLPAGRYTVDASTEGKTKSESVTLGAGSKTADFRF